MARRQIRVIKEMDRGVPRYRRRRRLIEDRARRAARERLPKNVLPVPGEEPTPPVKRPTVGPIVIPQTVYQEAPTIRSTQAEEKTDRPIQVEKKARTKKMARAATVPKSVPASRRKVRSASVPARRTGMSVVPPSRFDAGVLDSVSASDADTGKLVVVGAPVRDRARVLPEFLRCLRDLDYPRRNIGFYFIVNDSTDESMDILREFRDRYGSDYRFFDIEEENLGAPKDHRTTVRIKHIYANLAYFRTKLLRSTTRYGADHLFTVDSDIYVKPEILRRLMAFGVDVISAYCSVDYNKGRIGNMMVRRGPGGKGFVHVANPVRGLYEVDSTGGVVLVSRRVADSGVSYKFHPCGEDPGFVEELQAAGFSAFCLVGEDLAYHDMYKA